MGYLSTQPSLANSAGRTTASTASRPEPTRREAAGAASSDGPGIETASRLGHDFARLPVRESSPARPIQRYRLDGPVRLNAFARQGGESREAHRDRIAEELRAQRATMEAKDAQAIEERSPADYHGPAWPGDWEDEPRKAPSAEKRERVLARIWDAQRAQPVPTVAISHRGGFGYDTGAFTKGTTRAQVLSAPPGFDALPRGASERDAALQEAQVADARDPGAAAAHLAGASGLFIPGGQDTPEHGSREQTTREDYEQALIRNARNRGLPTLGVCGGSRCLARGFGGREAELSEEDKLVHNQRGTVRMPHGLRLTPHTILGGASPTPDGTVDRINSTHQKIVDFSRVHELEATGEPEIRPSATDEHGSPEGFETTHGAPIVGVTSHPEAIHGANRAARDAASPQGRHFSDSVFRGFEQAQRAYAGRQQVNAQILAQAGAPRHPPLFLPGHVDVDPDYHRVPPITFGSFRRPFTRRGGTW